MLSADQRLRRAGDFAAVIRGGRRAGRGGVVIHLRASDRDGAPRAGFVVPRAVGPAVTRNKIRRRLRHLLREELRQLAPGTDVVVRVLPAAAESSAADLRTDLASALTSASRGTPRRRRVETGEGSSASA